MSLTRAEHRDRAEQLLQQYESSRYSETSPNVLLHSIAHGLLAGGVDPVNLEPVGGRCANADERVDPFPDGLPPA